MRDWKELVREHLAACELPRAKREDVVCELAAHLEESYDEARSRGLNESAAAEATLQEVEDWRTLAAEICRAKSEEDLMNHRTKSLWLPALAAFLGASVSLMLCQFLGMQPRIVWVRHDAMWFYWPWIATLPILGAVGAYLSQRAQGPTVVRLAAGLSPALIMLTVLSLILPFGIAIDGFHFFQLVAFGLCLINWVAIPAAAVLLGAAPFLRLSRVREA
jgi:hypothetical protein